MEITLREDLDPDIDFYYLHQFKIYHDSYLIWDRDTWEAVLRTCTVYRIEADGQYAGDVILEDRGKRTKSIIDFSILPEYQGRGVGRAALEKVKEMGGTLTAVTRKETFDFFLKCGFVLKKLIKNYYHRGVDGYYIVAMGSEQIIGKREVRSV
jgi:ribosomal protein S18 acetylase RimI-like enzyme